MDVMCLVILQLLTLRFLANQSDTERRRNHPALGPHSILARLDAGETFDLPLPLIAFMRRTVREFRTDLRLDTTDFQRSEPPIPAQPQNPPVRPRTTHRRRIAHRRAAPTMVRAPQRAAIWPNHPTAQARGDPGRCEKISLARQRLATSISLR
jgi:hypothetical protein